MSDNATQVWIPFLSAALTAAVAAVAILANLRSNKQILTGQLSQRVWERRTEIYVEIIQQTDAIDPHNLKTPEGFRDAANEAVGEKVPLLPIDPESDEWRNFEAKIEAFSSPEVRYLYRLWDSAIAAWSWAIVTVVAHLQLGSEDVSQYQDRVQKSYDMIYGTREELIAQIRAELRFEGRKTDHISAEQDEHFGYLTSLEVNQNRRDARPIRSARMIDIEIDNRGNMHQSMRLGERVNDD
jgi:hypothetical protein